MYTFHTILNLYSLKFQKYTTLFAGKNLQTRNQLFLPKICHFTFYSQNSYKPFKFPGLL